MKHKASTLGMPNVGSGQNWRLMREILELLSRNIARRVGKTGPWFQHCGQLWPAHREATRVPTRNTGICGCWRSQVKRAASNLTERRG